MKVIKVIDRLGWAYYFIAKEQQKYSCHDLTYVTYEDANSKSLADADVVFFHEPSILINKVVSSTNAKIVGCYGNENRYRYDRVDLVAGISLPRMENLKKMYPDKPVVFLPESIDVESFFPKLNNDFKVGFAGRLHDVKRPSILDELKYPVIKKSDWGNEFFVERPHSMLDFYHSINVLVLTSKSESMPRVVLEAMACGLPVISTNVGSVPLLLDKKWITEVYPRQQVIDQTNAKLDLLKNKRLRAKVGERNRKHVEKYFDWKNTQFLWDMAFEATQNGNYDPIINSSGNFVASVLSA